MLLGAKSHRATMRTHLTASICHWPNNGNNLEMLNPPAADERPCKWSSDIWLIVSLDTCVTIFASDSTIGVLTGGFKWS